MFNIIDNLDKYVPIIQNNTTVINFNLKKYDDTKYSWIYHDFSNKVSFNTIQNFILDYIDKETTNSIISGFSWKNMPVWLSLENQINYKNIHDVAIQTGASNLPVTVKFGTQKNPIYYTFNVLDDLQDFYSKMVAHIHEQLSLGWKKKDDIDWNVYKLNNNEYSI